MVTMQAFRKALFSLTLLLVSQQMLAQDACEKWLGKLASSQGQVEIRRAGTSVWRPVIRGERYCDMDAIRTGRNSRAVLMLNTDPSNRTLTNLDQNTFLTFKSLGNEPNAFDLLIDLLKGGALFRSRQPNRLDIDTPFVNAVHKGTEFLVRVDADQTLVTVYDGQVATSNTEGKLTIDKGESALAKRGKAPVEYALMRPQGAVQWALNYPPLIDYHAARSMPSHPAIGDALSEYRRGDLLEGLAILDKAPEAQREPDYYTTKAGLLLSVGRVDEATPAIEKALTLDSKNATAVALKSVIAVAQNRNDEAMELAEQAAELDPESPTPQVALSYAHQAKFELEKALESAEKAVERGPGNALALSRLSELQLSTGDLDEALETAEKATVLDPDLARTQTVLGFAYLTKIDLDEARRTFEKAIELDQAAPLPYLGLGLAKIREGELKNGTDEIEIAASLDPDNSLIRSYLGKAFYEKKENILAGTELEIAKELDPNDPTPWFYDAIRKQTTNRPVEALHDMQKAIDLNDNRAVYRSRLLLDDDLAARGAALGRIYNELGFEQRGLIEGWTSVTADPSNHSAHRLLSDTYAGLPRHETARVSELLQSQLLQPINITPVQPQLAESDLFLLGGLGPAEPSLNEFNSLFARDRLSLLASGLVGSNETFGDEVVQSGLWKSFSYSLGQFHYETDGFRPNSDLETDIYSVFMQLGLSPQTSMQLELRYQDTESGDLRELSNPDFRFENLREDFHRDTARLGFRHGLSPTSDLIGSLGYRKVTRNTNLPTLETFSEIFSFDPDLSSSVAPLLPLGFSRETFADNEIENTGIEIQYSKRWNRLNVIAGGGYTDLKRTKTTGSAAILTAPLSADFPQQLEQLGFDPAEVDALTGFVDDAIKERLEQNLNEERSDESYSNAYLYSNLEVIDDLNLTVGVAYLSVDRDSSQTNRLDLSRQYVSPKVGAIWRPAAATTFRAAWLKNVQHAIASGQTIEPTQVAGFNQLYDDGDATKSERYGFGLDQLLPMRIKVGGELSWRDVDIPRFLTGIGAGVRWIEQNEEAHRAYIYWTPSDRFALAATYFFESFNRDRRIDIDGGVPLELTTHRAPFSLSYYNSNGLFSNVTATYIDQDVVVRGFESLDSNQNDKFWVLDASIGYRLPKRWGIINVGVRNLLDKEFFFQESEFDLVGEIDGELLPPTFASERVFFAQATIAF